MSGRSGRAASGALRPGVVGVQALGRFASELPVVTRCVNEQHSEYTGEEDSHDYRREQVQAPHGASLAERARPDPHDHALTRYLRQVSWVSSLLGRYDALDALLVERNFPATSPWWRSRLERFLRSGRRRWVLRVGRRGGKSTTLCRLMTVWALWGPWSIPPGDTAVISIVSVDRQEASGRLVTLKAILDALGVDYDQRGQELHIPERRMAFSVKTCSTSGTVGFTSIAMWADEMAKWESRDTAANPAREVMASLRPSAATQPLAFEVDCSAPWGTDDYHAELFAAGDTGEQCVDHAATWEANPTISEERTHELEPDLREWSRAYAAIPSETVQGDFFGVGLDMALTQPRVVEAILPWVRYWVSIDPAFQHDFFGWAVCSSRSLPPDPRNPDRDRRITRVHETGAWKVEGKKPLEMAFRLRNEVCARYQPQSELYKAVSDQYEGHSFGELARQAGILITVVPWIAGVSETSQISRYRKLRVAMLEGALLLPDDAKLVSELRAVRVVTLPSGNERIELPRQREAGHLDRISALVLGASEAMAQLAQPEQHPQPVRTETELLRDKARQEVIEKRRREWERNPRVAMRKAMGM